MSLPTTQTAWHQIARGRPNQVLKLRKDAPIPTPNKDEVLVKVHSVVLNPVTYRFMPVFPWPLVSFPLIPEMEMSGTVVDSNGHSDFSEGQEVMGMTDVLPKGGKGVMAEYIVIKVANILRKPTHLDMTQSAGACASSIPIYRALKPMTIQPGSRIFINGGSTSLGLMAIQILKREYGADWVAVSCSGRNEELVKGYGADEVLDYTQSPLIDQLKATSEPFNIIFDFVGDPPLFKFCPSYLTEDGTFFVMALDLEKPTLGGSISALAAHLWITALQPVWMGGINRKAKIVSGEWKKEDMTEVLTVLEKHDIQIQIDSIHKPDVDGVMAAYDRIKSRRARGKVVVQMAG